MTEARTRVRVKRWKKLPVVFRTALRVKRFKGPPPALLPLYQTPVEGFYEAYQVWMSENLY